MGTFLKMRVNQIRVNQGLGVFSYQYSAIFFVHNREKFLVTPLIVHCLYTYGHRVLYTQCSKTSCICGMCYVVYIDVFNEVCCNEIG